MFMVDVPCHVMFRGEWGGLPEALGGMLASSGPLPLLTRNILRGSHGVCAGGAFVPEVLLRSKGSSLQMDILTKNFWGKSWKIRVHESSDQNPYHISLYRLIHRDPYIGILQSPNTRVAQSSI